MSKWLLYPLCYYVFRYRRKIVRENLLIAFSEKPVTDIKHIERDFYLAFTDMIVEVLVRRCLSEEDMRRFVVINNMEGPLRDSKVYGACFFMFGHFINWEWFADGTKRFAADGVECGMVYKRLTNAFFDKLMHKLRANEGGFLVEMNQVLRVLVSRKNNPEALPACYAMLADQRPRKNAKQHSTVLLNRRVGMLMGTEQLALRFRYPVYGVTLCSPRRGYYEATFVKFYDPHTDGQLDEGVITERFTRFLEDNIRQNPSRWLWTHRRFAGSTPLDDYSADSL